MVAEGREGQNREEQLEVVEGQPFLLVVAHEGGVVEEEVGDAWLRGGVPETMQTKPAST